VEPATRPAGIRPSAASAFTLAIRSPAWRQEHWCFGSLLLTDQTVPL